MSLLKSAGWGVLGGILGAIVFSTILTAFLVLLNIALAFSIQYMFEILLYFSILGGWFIFPVLIPFLIISRLKEKAGTLDRLIIGIVSGIVFPIISIPILLSLYGTNWIFSSMMNSIASIVSGIMNDILRSSPIQIPFLFRIIESQVFGVRSFTVLGVILGGLTGYLKKQPAPTKHPHPPAPPRPPPPPVPNRQS